MAWSRQPPILHDTWCCVSCVMVLIAPRQSFGFGLLRVKARLSCPYGISFVFSQRAIPVFTISHFLPRVVVFGAFYLDTRFARRKRPRRQSNVSKRNAISNSRKNHQSGKPNTREYQSPPQSWQNSHLPCSAPIPSSCKIEASGVGQGHFEAKRKMDVPPARTKGWRVCLTDIRPLS